MSLQTCNTILDAIGSTPLVRLNHVADAISATVYAKIEGLNPGLSSKDRIALFMIEQAEQQGILTEGGTVIEATSGNTGFGIAMVCAVKGYNCVLFTKKKTSEEKLRALEAMGATVHICPSVGLEDPRNYITAARLLGERTPNSLYMNQNYGGGNPDAHYAMTGPEIWQQTQGKITHLVCCVGTGGTISGIARYLKEQNPAIRIIGVDAYGSVLGTYHETGKFEPREIKSYNVEGLGKSIIPGNVDFALIDRFIKVNDYESAMAARRLAKEEGLFVGYSSGSALCAVHKLKDELCEGDVVVSLFSDHGTKYLSKIYNEDWMEDNIYNNPASKRGSVQYMPQEVVKKKKTA